MAKSTMNFQNAAAYHRWLSYGHMHGQFARSPGNTPVKIKGKAHAVAHVGSKRRMAKALMG